MSKERCMIVSISREMDGRLTGCCTGASMSRSKGRDLALDMVGSQDENSLPESYDFLEDLVAGLIAYSDAPSALMDGLGSRVSAIHDEFTRIKELYSTYRAPSAGEKS